MDRTGGSAALPSPRHRLAHLRALDGLRGFAVLAVVLFHFSPDIAPGGFFGVDIFFVLSGFLITSLLVSEHASEGRISLRDFWARRARRLLPALFLVLVAVAVYALVVATQVTAHHIAEDGLASLFYGANWHFIVSGEGYVEQFIQQAPSPLRHMWSLAIEEQFYVVWPLVVVGIGAIATRSIRGGRRGVQGRRTVRSRRRFRHVLAVACVVLGALSLMEMVALFDAGDPDRVYYGTDTRAFLLLIGAALGAITAGALEIRRRVPRILMIVTGCIAIGVIVAAIGALETTDSFLYQGGYGLVAVLIALVLVAAGQPGLNPLARVLEHRALVGLGLISYGVYLWHWPVVVWVTERGTGLDGPSLFVVRAAITLTVSLASYWLVEQPIRHRRWPRWVMRRGVVPAGTVAMLLVLLAVPVMAFPSIAKAPNVKPTSSAEVIARTYETVARCEGTLATKSPDTPGTPPPSGASGRTPIVQLVGNSMAAELVPCLTDLVAQGGGALETVTAYGYLPCDLVPIVREQVANPATRPDVAIWFSFDWYSDAACDYVDWREPLEDALSIWKEAGTTVYLVPLVPNLAERPNPNELVIHGPVLTVSVPAQVKDFEAYAAADPEHVKVIDAGLFVRDANGVYQWRMPCLPGGEPGCAEDGTIGIRFVDGLHFCEFQVEGTCTLDGSGGARRVSAAIAAQIEELDLPRAGVLTGALP